MRRHARTALCLLWSSTLGAAPAPETTAPPPPPAELSLSGLVRATDARRSSALLVAHGRSRVLTVGERAFGARLLAVDEAGVQLEVAGRTIALRLTEARTVERVATPVAGTGQDQAGPTQVLERAEVERRLTAEMPSILADTALIPVSDGGQVTGFTLSRLPDTGLLRDVGLQPGDVLTEINGVPIDGLPTLIGLYARLRGETEIHATVLRGGSPVALTLRLR